ncbi:MAG: hypothetical protein ABFD54_04525 [Armatimonadota bacterium]
MGALTPIAQVLSEHVDRQNQLADLEAEARLKAKQVREAREADAAEAAAAVEKQQAFEAAQNKIRDQRVHFSGLTSPVQQALMQAGVDPNQPDYYDKLAAVTASTPDGQPHTVDTGLARNFDVNVSGAPRQPVKSPIADSLAGTVQMPRAQLTNLDTAKKTQGITLETTAEANQRRLAGDAEEKAATNARKLVSADIATFKSKDFMDNIMNSPGLKKGYLDAHNANRIAAGMEPLSMPDFDQLVLGPQAQASVNEKNAHAKAILAEIDNDKKQLDLAWQKFNETTRHNKAGEALGKARVGIAAQNANTAAGRAATYAGYLDFAKTKAKQAGPMTDAEISAALSKYTAAKAKVDEGYESYKPVKLFNGERLKAAGINPDTGKPIKKAMVGIVGNVDPWRNLANAANELPEGELKQKVTAILNTKPKGANPKTIYNDLMKRLGK